MRRIARHRGDSVCTRALIVCVLQDENVGARQARPAPYLSTSSFRPDPDPPVTRVLIVEDNPEIAEGISLNLVHEGYDVRIAGDGEAGLDVCRAWRPDLIILDLLLPGLDGYGVLRTLRAEGTNTPVLILSALGGEVDRVRGFRVGADDYVVKPFGLLELLARVEAILRRTAPGQVAPVADIRYGALCISPLARRVTLGESEIPLRAKAFELLLALARKPDEVLSRGRLLVDIWDYQAGVASRTVDWHVAELRRRLEGDANSAKVIETVRSIGYRFNSAAARRMELSRHGAG